MRPHRLFGLSLASMIVVSVLVGACTRSASTPPPTGAPKGETPSAPSGQQATMEAVRSALLTQTAQATANAPGATDTPSLPSTPTAETPTPGLTQVTIVTPSAGGQTEYTVKEGDWVYSIARKFGVDPEAIISLNGLTAPYALQVGQVLKIPAAGTPVPPTAVAPTITPGGPTLTPGGPTATPGGRIHIVQQGEWVYSIARQYGVDPYAIINANHLQAPYLIYPGDKLIIP